jgi:hypothetical protein
MRLAGSWVLGLLSLAGCSGGDPTATDPDLLFEDAFDNAPSEVEVVADGGTMVRGLDGWLKLRPGITGLKPRQVERYSYRDCAEPLAWFAKASGEAGLASGQGGFVCQESSDPRFQFDNGRWLVTDRGSGLVYYRIWKHF